MKSKLKMGMIGGGKGAFIGAIHRIASNMDGLAELVCGAFSSDEKTAMESGKELFLPENRTYKNYIRMFEEESKLPVEERMDFVAIVTPNFEHFAPAMLALEKGFHVIVEKPITLSLDEAKQLRDKVLETNLLLLLTHTYTGYPMVKQARHMISEGALGKVRKIYVEYAQGWLSTLTESEGNNGAVWRTDPKKSGKSCSMGDIGTHAANLAEYVSGLRIKELCASLNTVVEGRKLDDDGAVLLKFNQGASGVLIATQVACGEENNLKIRIYGEKGGLEWSQQEPNTLIAKWPDRPAELIRAGVNYKSFLSASAIHNSRTPGGHPEGYLEAFGNLYRNFLLTLSALKDGITPDQEVLDFPTAADGVRGMAFIEKVVYSSESSEKWIKLEV